MSDDQRDIPHVPAPSLWPIGFAIGVACILVGLVVSIPALIVGLPYPFALAVVVAVGSPGAHRRARGTPAHPAPGPAADHQQEAK